MESPERDKELRAILREAAQDYEPDRTRISNRVAAGRAAPPPKGWILRPMAAAAAVVVISVLSVVAVRASDDPVAPPPLAAPAATAPSASRAGTATDQHPSRPPSSSPDAPPSSGSAWPSSNGPSSGGPSSGGPSTDRPAPGFLSSQGAVGPDSVATWSEQKVTITNTEAIDALTVTIKVALAAEPTEAGKWTTVPNNDLTVSVTRSKTALTYTFKLNDGAKLIPGRYVFAAQFNHHAGRAMSKDSYTITASSDGDDGDMAGGFA